MLCAHLCWCRFQLQKKFQQEAWNTFVVLSFVPFLMLTWKKSFKKFWGNHLFHSYLWLTSQSILQHPVDDVFSVIVFVSFYTKRFRLKINIFPSSLGRIQVESSDIARTDENGIFLGFLFSSLLKHIIIALESRLKSSKTLDVNKNRKKI